ncbi:MAG: hypothetical protein A2W91_20160 [Bacteroidetes bacterium GWF2_38_335]|nr:MAG: hypothetical protein A2W91_20160 [Bacteroidetes bacterium GWF2_38_335]HBS86536.1 hypothetical protein [Bacteroidales bacterium]
MKNSIYLYIKIILIICNTVCYGQSAFNTSFAFSSPFNLINLNGGKDEPLDIIGTSDGGFVYLSHLQLNCQIYNDCRKFVIDGKCQDVAKCSPFLVKVNKLKEIEWVKETDIRGYKYFPSNSKAFNIIETKDKGFLLNKSGSFYRLDSLGNPKWSLYMDEDSIPGIKKSKFLFELGVRDIKECKDGSFIALLDNSFSLLKISEDGKPIWLKSLVFKNFDDYLVICHDTLFERKDTIIFNKIKWDNGGGAYIKTSTVFETDDGGYLSLGKASFRNEKIQKIYDSGNKNKGAFLKGKKFKLFCDDKEFNKKSVLVSPKRIIFQYHPSLVNADVYEPDENTVLIKTDSIGNVQWEKEFGDFSWTDQLYYSNLVKIPEKGWLVHIQDRDRVLNSEYVDGYGPPCPEYYLLNNNGDIIGRPRFSDEFEENNRPLSIHPTKIELAPDNGFYLFSQGKVVKADSSYELKWGQFFGGMALDIGEYGILSDTGVVCSERGWFYKYDKYGHDFSDSVRVEVSIEDHGTELFLRSKDPKTPVCYLGKKTFYYKYIHFKIITNKKDAGILIVEPEDLATNKNYKRQFDACSVYIIASGDRVRLQNKCREYFKNHRITNKPGKDPYCLNLRGFSPGQYQFAINKNTFDLDNKMHLNSLIMYPEDAVLFPNAFEFDNFYGFRNIYCIFLKDGKYVYKLLDRETGKIIDSGKFVFFSK